MVGELRTTQNFDLSIQELDVPIIITHNSIYPFINLKTTKRNRTTPCELMTNKIYVNDIAFIDSITKKVTLFY